MIFFSLDKVKKSAETAEEIKHRLYYITYKPIPSGLNTIRWLRYQTTNWFGDSFLLNPEGLIDEWHHYSDKEVLQYIFVAARRRYVDYKLFGITTLNNINVNTKVLEKNRLLNITDSKIYFKYEELKWL